jgi:hypothetical protein
MPAHSFYNSSGTQDQQHYTSVVDRALVAASAGGREKLINEDMGPTSKEGACAEECDMTRQRQGGLGGFGSC